MAAVDLSRMSQQPPLAPAAPRTEVVRQGAATADGVREQVRNTIREVQEAARQAAADAAKDAAREGKNVRIASDGTVTIDGETVFAPALAGTTGHDPFDNSKIIPPQIVDMSIAFFIMCAVMVVGWPLARAFGRRIERSGGVPAAIPAAVSEQLQRIEQTVDAMSVEVERISEAQRFMAKLQSQGAEHMALPPDRG